MQMCESVLRGGGHPCHTDEKIPESAVRAFRYLHCVKNSAYYDCIVIGDIRTDDEFVRGADYWQG